MSVSTEYFARSEAPPERRRAEIPLWLELAWQAVLIFAAFMTYFGVRGATEGSQSRAIANADTLVEIERGLGILWEPDLQSLIVDNQALINLANWVYIWGHWPAIGVITITLFTWRRDDFYLMRNAVFLSGAIGLIFFLTIPMAPPRLLDDFAVIDTVTAHSTAYRTLQPPTFTNQYAAFPSLHFGFNLLAGIVLFRLARRPWLKVIGVAMPTAMAAACVLTANHYVLDIVGGGIVALIGLWLAFRIEHQGFANDLRSAVARRLFSRS